MRKMMMMLVVVAVTASGLSAQKVKVVEKEDKKEQRKKKRAVRKAEYELFKAEGLNKIDERNFVLQAEQISGRLGRPILVTDNLNFVKIDGDHITVQFAVANQIGFNGLGGATFEGPIKKLVSKDLGKGKPGNVRIDFVSPYTRGMVTLYIDIKGDKASAQLLNNGGIINFSGKYLSKEEALIVEARNNGIY